MNINLFTGWLALVRRDREFFYKHLDRKERRSIRCFENLLNNGEEIRESYLDPIRQINEKARLFILKNRKNREPNPKYTQLTLF